MSIPTGAANVENLGAYDCRNGAFGIQSCRAGDSASAASGLAPAGWFRRQMSKDGGELAANVKNCSAANCKKPQAGNSK
jgi:hypothetical protein